MRIIPAIDLIDGKCVRLTRGDYSTKKIYSGDPLEVAKSFEDAGIRYLHLVDLDGARSAHIVNHRILKSDEDVRIAFECGAAQITGGSIAATAPDQFLSWLETYGPDRVILGADAREGYIAVSGWEEGTNQKLLPYVARFQKRGIKYVVCTDISRDGMLEGPAVSLYRNLLKRTAVVETRVGMSGVEDIEKPGIHLIASGGVSSLEDLRQLKQIGCEGAILGKALYEGRITIEELQRLLSE